jgi:hypothetical protein
MPTANRRTTEPPTGITVSKLGSNLVLTCKLCRLIWSRSYGHKPTKSDDKMQRAARGVCGHLEDQHAQKLKYPDAIRWVEAQLGKIAEESNTSDVQHSKLTPFAPPNFKIRCRL